MRSINQLNIGLTETKYGKFYYLKSDAIIGKSLEIYGEWAVPEIELLTSFIEEGDIVIDVGAYIGTHTIPFAQKLNGKGFVIAFEPQEIIFNILAKNIRTNNADNVQIFNKAVLDKNTITYIETFNYNETNNFGSAKIITDDIETQGIIKKIEAITIDSLELNNCKLIKIDVEGQEEFVLRGSEKTIKSFMPIIYFESNELEKTWNSICLVKKWGYDTFLFRFPAFNPFNIKGTQDNIFGYACETGILGIHKSKLSTYGNDTLKWRKLNYLFEITTLDDLAFLLIETSRGHDPIIPDIKYNEIRNIKFLQNYIIEVVKEIEKKDKLLQTIKEDLKIKEQHLQSIYCSEGWKLLTKCYKIRDKIFPPNSKRRELAKFILFIMKKLNLKFVQEIIRFARMYGIKALYNRSRIALHSMKSYSSNQENYFVPEQFERDYLLSEISVDIIVPIYNAYEDLKRCVESILKHTDLKKHRLVLINDCSTDERIYSFLKNLENERTEENLLVIHNKENLGFVKTVNKGISLSNKDVIILNSDTIVTARWVEKLIRAAYSRSNVATVTPFSNNATICSLPIMLKDNSLPLDWDIDYFAKVVDRISLLKYPEIPTAVGFCMYIKREVIEKIGMFNEEKFGKGYGEENDFCMRALNEGYVNILCDNLFIYHKGSQSFTEEVKRKREMESLKVINQLHPFYSEMVKAFIEKNPLKYYHSTLEEIMSLYNLLKSEEKK
ncbi:FkbM family methyltransferase [Caldicellulosiruptor bescii]|uniref:Methyltransferase FkbM family n=2 Tax=Caldicellulosiruptor bescii TaxID=31899 RepID=B9MLL1_CALBD|nr:FkbM family methyltransferase [Caldicellulosiruptor bescii]ACM59219.1 methyltransferase FkbM family [Caldicellulosiruptor bescii DSM 6725]PBC88324.1 FkbM family methyltransferase [Caldicellulosiruptor bescii]PBC92195.1 FkbM family methyltransferase [Caldicellulosiruptor bescii]PBD04995.1 FkbM family methyltransferase [Caldicellulosiruptor bescii]PBD05374.1 FkbM family methyltransferase [Caldicellulosiruptor bescii]